MSSNGSDIGTSEMSAPTGSTTYHNGGVEAVEAENNPWQPDTGDSGGTKGTGGSGGTKGTGGSSGTKGSGGTGGTKGTGGADGSGGTGGTKGTGGSGGTKGTGGTGGTKGTGGTDGSGGTGGSKGTGGSGGTKGTGGSGGTKGTGGSGGTGGTKGSGGTSGTDGTGGTGGTKGTGGSGGTKATKGGPVDGTASADLMLPGYVDPQNDYIDGPDGNDDVIYAYDGDDTIDSGLGADLVDGGAGDDIFDLNDEGHGIDNDTLIGGETNEDGGGDTLDASDIGDDLELVLNVSDPEAGILTDGTDTVQFSEIENFVLGSGDDTVTGSDGGDNVDGGAGDDAMFGYGGDDSFVGGAGEDTLVGGAGDDTLNGGAGNDSILGGDGSDVVEDLEGDNVINTSGTDPRPDLGYPGLYSADIDPNNDRDIVITGAGNDTITTGDDADLIIAGAGDDIINAGFDADTIDGGAGDDEIIGGEGSDLIDGGDGNDVIFGGLDPSLPDALNIPDDGSGPFGPDLVPNNGMDTIDGGAGDDLIFGQDDDDVILGGSGNDTIDAGIDDDLVDGGSGDDLIAGGQGNDTIEGSTGDDTIDGGSGQDSYDALSGSTLGGERIIVEVNDAGDGTVDKVNDASTDTVSSVENFVAREDLDPDEITLTSGIAEADIPTEIQGLSDAAQGTFTTPGGAVIAFGGPGQPVLSEILSGSYDPGTGPVSPRGAYSITDGDEDGQIGNISFENFETINFRVIPCFTPGTLIGTARGEIPVEMLREGDRVVTRDNGVQEIRWIGHKTVNVRTLAERPDMQPILIRRGALGNGLPERDMTVSPNHRLLVANDQSALYFDEREVLAAAKHLVNGHSIRQIETRGTTYVHLMFDHHEVVLSDGTWTESFQPGDYSLKGIGDEQRDEIFDLFPELRNHDGLVAYGAARNTLKRHEAELLTF